MNNLLQKATPGRYKTASFIGMGGVLPEETKRYFQHKDRKGYSRPFIFLVTAPTEALRFTYGN
jgi:hypothetical protein